MAMPISDITVRTSAKSTLIRPGRVISSAIPCTAPSSTLLAALKASSKVICLPSTVSSFSLGIVINESTDFFSSAIPSSATSIRFLPSNGKGLVTTATVRIPISLATWATIGAPPVPVPPPIPAVMNTISAPAMASSIRSRSSIAACRPISGFAPAPRPLVMCVPIWITVRLDALSSAWASVLAQIKSTPSILAHTICSTALPPPPPTPITLMTALWLLLSISSNMPHLLVLAGHTRRLLLGE